ncbi:DUF5979 domain-containing protein [Leifsonia sp. PS1209]|uniref:DUF5979 domain-containing protein n=1 Tax=Leifsonia sp. PS1209 TaxID=2724914 RepID=UPI001442D181|nr:DUF5979 domain-containing protein [Leifsonia sp. PS1209]QIZ98779.1 hypothetical protein HF024_09885 [Leifsonia sp. PS1209]
MIPVAAAPAAAEGPSELTLTKTASATTVAPGETFTYTLEVGCSAVDIGTGCTNATLTDSVPGAFEVVSVSVGTGLSAETPQVSGQDVTVVFNSPLDDPPGAIGLPASATGVVTITVRARDDLPFEASGIPVPNSAELTATNQLAPADSTASVTPIVPLDLATTASKSFDPTGAPADPGTPTTLTLTGTNTSNAGVDSIVLTDPPDPTATPNPFDHLALDSLGTVTFPAPADQVQVDVWDGTKWVLGTPGPTAVLPGGVPADGVSGVRITFSNSAGEPIPADASGSVEVNLVQRPDVADLTAAFVVDNTVQSEVTHGTDTATGTASADYTIQSSVVTVAATKSFNPNPIVAGDPTTVTIGGTNQSAVPLTELSFTEPTLTGADPFADGFPAGTSFAGFTSGVEWPDGATGVSVHYYYADGTDEVLTSTTPDSIPAPDPAKSVARFSVTFTGTIPPGASASIPFTLDTDAGITTDSTTISNSQTVDGTSASGTTGTATATADLTVYTSRLDTTIGKVISPNEIASSAGEFVTVQLPASTSPFPQSTVDATTIVVQDPPGDPPALTDWWNHFDATAITQTAVPAGSTLTIQYWDGTQWVDLPGAVGIAGPTVFSMDIPADLQDDIQGLRFVYTAPDGFPPGTTVQPNVTMSLRDQLRDGSGPATGTDETIENCAASSATGVGGESASAVIPSPCPVVDLIAGVLPGGDDFLTKSWAAPKVLTARSEAQTTATLDWSTGGRANLGTMVISDPSDPATTALSDSVFNAFDLVGIPAITAAQDPHLIYDQVTSVQLYNGTAWVDAANDPCPAACIGTFPGLTLTAAEQASTVGMRMTYAESPDRASASAGDPTAPPVGSGVARSTGNDRAIVLTFQLRDEVRAPVTTPDPVIATRLYNTGTAGEIENTARATGTSSVDGSTVTDTAADIVRLLDVPLNVTLSKTWEGGPLGVPQAGVDPALYPSGRITLVATNTTAASVDNLTISDPAPGSSSTPFEVFDLVKFESIGVPAGATASTVELTTAGGVTTGYSIADALALTPAQLADVVSLRVVHTGRIQAGEASTVVFDTRLRATGRTSGDPVTAAEFSPVENVAQAGVSDEGGAAGGSPTTNASGSIELADGVLTVATSKTIVPAQQTEPDDSPVTVTMSGQPGGTVRARRITLSDASGTFWNAFDFVGFSTPLALTAPIDRVQIDVCTGRSFGDPTADCEADGGTWILGVRQTEADANASPLPAGVTADQVEGIRFVFTQLNGDLLQPSPLQTVAISAQRRADLRSGGPVPSDLSTNAPAPGESAAGTFTNTVDALAEGTFETGGPPYTATDSSTAIVQYLHATSAVQVSKSPAGVQQPGTVIPYTLTVTNTGAIAVTDPVITDQLPTDAVGPLLVFDPFADPGTSPYSYALAGAAPAPPGGPPMPTDPADVDATVSQAGARIQFTFPLGTVLEVGQTYTITIALMFRTGLAAGTNVTNTLSVAGDRPFDSCGGTLDPATGACSTDTTVTVETAGALRGIKGVRATDTELGVESTNPAVTCVPDADGFYAGPCVPITKPGGTEVWRLNLINTGTLPMDRMVAIDKLPTPGDTGVLTPLPRGSEFRPTYTGSAVLASAPPGATLAQYYTTDAAPCTDDLSTTGVACPPGAWTPWDAAVDPTTVTGLKFVVTFDPTIAPGGAIAIDVTTRTPAVPPTGLDDPIAWNTVGVAGRVLVGATPTVTAQTEGNKVGVALATGPVSVIKQVTGAGAGYAPATFTGELRCVSAGVALDPIPVTLTPGTPVTVDDLPWGAECTVVEDDAGQTSGTATQVVVGTGTDPVPVISVTNVYDLAGLVVVKSVDSNAVDQDGTPIAYGPFTVTVDCTFLGAAVYADGYGPLRPMTADLTDGEALTLSGLPAGASCVVTETDAKGAASTTTTTVTSGGTTGPTAGDSTTVVLTPDAGTDPTSTVTVTNTFGVGAIRLVKVVDGAGGAAFGAGPFVLHVSCTLDDASGSRSTWDGDVTLGGTQPLQKVVAGIAAGSVCAVTEPGAGGANASVVSPGEVTVGSGDTVTVTATNTFLTGAIHVDKVRTGDGADLYGAGPFTVALACVHPVDGVPTPVVVPGGATRTLSADTAYSADYELLPADAVCLLRETGAAGATSSQVLDENGEPAGPTLVVAGETVTLNVVNTFDVGSLTVHKVIAGDGAGERGGGSFVVHLSCTAAIDGMPAPVAIPGGPDRTLSRSTSLTAEYTDLPAGATCRVTESSDGGADRTTITPNDGDGSVGVVTVGDAVPVDITVTNTFDPAAPALSDTGSDTLPVAILALALLGAGLLIRRRHDRDAREER